MRFRIAAGIFAFFSMTTFASVAATTGMVPVTNMTKFDNFQEFADKNLGPELKEVLQRRGLAIWGFAESLELKGTLHCVGLVGITHAEVKDRNSRFPVITFTSTDHRPASDVAGKNSCRADSLRLALNSMNNSPIEEVLAGIEKTELGGGTKAPGGKADNAKVTLWTRDVSSAGRSELFELLHKYRVGELIDYRYVQAAVIATSTESKDGQRTCWAVAGLTAKNPENRLPRSPTLYNSGLFVLPNGGDVNDCKTQASSAAIEGVLDAPWTEQGVLAQFSKAREDGLPMPNVGAIAKKRSEMLAQNNNSAQTNLRATRVASTQKNTLSCTNECQNGACLRTFSDGRKEHWQAPRKFDAFSGDWKWDTSSCGG